MISVHYIDHSRFVSFGPKDPSERYRLVSPVEKHIWRDVHTRKMGFYAHIVEKPSRLTHFLPGRQRIGIDYDDIIQDEFIFCNILLNFIG